MANLLRSLIFRKQRSTFQVVDDMWAVFFKNLILALNYQGGASPHHISGAAKFIFLISALVVVFLGSLGNKDAMACALDSPLGFKAFSVSHKGVISVAIATRAAVETGHLSALPEHEQKRQWLLSLISRRAVTHMSVLSQRDPSGPPISVLLTQTGAWMRFNDPEFGAKYHTSAPDQGELTILLPDIAYSELLSGKLSVDDLIHLKVLRIFGNSEEDSTNAVDVFKNAIKTGTHLAKKSRYF